MIEGKFERAEGAKPVDVCQSDFGFIVQPSTTILKRSWKASLRRYARTVFRFVTEQIARHPAGLLQRGSASKSVWREWRRFNNRKLPPVIRIIVTTVSGPEAAGEDALRAASCATRGIRREILAVSLLCVTVLNPQVELRTLRRILVSTLSPMNRRLSASPALLC